jgi:ribose 5-phosphate isomerase B
MKIIIGNDHAGLDFKHHIITYLKSKNIEVIDVGSSEKESVDYPDYAQIVSKEVLKDSNALGILICGTGIGMSIAANKYKGIRAALIYDIDTATLAKAHNKANVICLGSRKTSHIDATKMIEAFLDTDFESRHQRRIDKINI